MANRNFPYFFFVALPMLAEGCKVSLNMSLNTSLPMWIREIPDYLKTLEVCDESVWIEPYSLKFESNHLKIMEMFLNAVRINPYLLEFLPN